MSSVKTVLLVEIHGLPKPFRQVRLSQTPQQQK
jgi:hypothetical protein